MKSYNAHWKDLSLAQLVLWTDVFCIISVLWNRELTAVWEGWLVYLQDSKRCFWIENVKIPRKKMGPTTESLDNQGELKGGRSDLKLVYVVCMIRFKKWSLLKGHNHDLEISVQSVKRPTCLSYVHKVRQLMKQKTGLQLSVGYWRSR